MLYPPFTVVQLSFSIWRVKLGILSLTIQEVNQLVVNEMSATGLKGWQLQDYRWRSYWCNREPLKNKNLIDSYLVIYDKQKNAIDGRFYPREHFPQRTFLEAEWPTRVPSARVRNGDNCEIPDEEVDWLSFEGNLREPNAPGPDLPPTNRVPLNMDSII